MTKKITTTMFAELVRKGDKDIINRYSEQTGIEVKTLKQVARQLIRRPESKFIIRSINKGYFKGHTDLMVSFKLRGYYSENTHIKWCVNKDGVCYVVYNKCFCK